MSTSGKPHKLVNPPPSVQDTTGSPSKSSKSKGCLYLLNLCFVPHAEGLEPLNVLLKDLSIYIVYLVALSVVVFGAVTPYQFFYATSIQRLFVDGSNLDTPWEEIQDWEGLWEYLQSSFVDGIYDTNTQNDPDQLFVYNENKLLSRPRLRQLKVGNNTCTVPSIFANDIDECFGGYTGKNEILEDIAFNPVSSVSSGNAGEYIPIATNLTYAGNIAQYGRGGFVQVLAKTKEETMLILDDLKRNTWLDRGTRVLFIDFAMYNPNINMFCVVKLVAEFVPTGGVVTSFDINVLKLLRYVTPRDNITRGFEMALLVILIYYIAEEFIEISVVRFKYILQFWNMYDWLIIIGILSCAGMSIYRNIVVKAYVERADATAEVFLDFDQIAFFERTYNQISALVLFLSWIKMFKYLGFNKTMRHFSTTLERCSRDILSFAVMFFIVFFAFAQLGLLLFGTVLSDFSTFTYSTYTLFRIILGDFDFLALEQASKTFGPTYFILYIFTVFFILLNMFLAIINDTYTAVKVEIDEEEEDTTGLEAELRRKAQNVLNVFRRKRPDSGNKGAAAVESDTHVQKGADIPMSKSPHGAATHHYDVPTLEEFRILARRVDRYDDAMGSVVSKIDAILMKLELVEKAMAGRPPRRPSLIDEDEHPARQPSLPDFIETEQTVHIPDETELNGRGHPSMSSGSDRSYYPRSASFEG